MPYIEYKDYDRITINTQQNNIKVQQKIAETRLLRSTFVVHFCGDGFDSWQVSREWGFIGVVTSFLSITFLWQWQTKRTTTKTNTKNPNDGSSCLFWHPARNDNDNDNINKGRSGASTKDEQ